MLNIVKTKRQFGIVNISQSLFALKSFKLKGESMRKIVKFGFLSLVLMLVVTACSRTSTVMNVPNQEITTSKTKEDVFNAIKRAGAGLGWIVAKEQDNKAIATLNLRTHQAVVVINYTAKDYSIGYKSSIDLDYNAQENIIHSNYNGWIQNLNNAIKVQLSL